MGTFSKIFICIFIQVICFASISYGNTTVLYVGGWGMTPEQMAAFSGSASDTDKTTYLLPQSLAELVRPWHCAQLLYADLKQKNLTDKNVIIVAFSYGGIVTQWLLDAHPELNVQKLIMVGTPIGGYKFVPPNNFFSNKFPVNLPIYVVAGNKSRETWFLKNENDGVVDLSSVLDIQDNNLTDFAIFNVDHSDLWKSPEIQNKISIWLDANHSLNAKAVVINSNTLRAHLQSNKTDNLSGRFKN